MKSVESILWYYDSYNSSTTYFKYLTNVFFRSDMVCIGTYGLI